MRYRRFRSRGLFTGSGVVEAGCKSNVGQREAICNTPHTQTRTA